MNQLAAKPVQRRLTHRDINRVPSPLRAGVVPYASIMLGSLLPVFIMADAMPALPPVGFILLVGWRIMRPGLLPLWAGAPLGLFDDLFSGQPIGSAIFLWSLAMIVIEMIDARFPWRGFIEDWFTASLAILLYIFVAMVVSGASITLHQIVAALPQVLLSILLYPVFALIVARLDQFRLRRVRRIG
jgi:rod shape-determining protein MreD